MTMVVAGAGGEEAAEGVDFGLVGGEVPPDFDVDPAPRELAAGLGAGWLPLGRVGVGLGLIGGGADGEELGGVEVVGEGPSPVGRPGVGAGVPRLGQGDHVVDLELGRVGGAHAVVAAGPVAG